MIGVDQCEFDELEHDPDVEDDADETDMNDMVCALSRPVVIGKRGNDRMYMLLLILVCIDDLTRPGAVWRN